MTKHVIAGIAATAALAIASGAPAQTPVTQNANNAGPITNAGTITISGGGVSGTGGSAAISATGAVSATSVSGINTDLPGPVGGFSTVSQTATNSGPVLNSNPAAIDIDGGGGIFGLAASSSITATGSLASFSFSGIGNSPWTTPAVGSIVQTSQNHGSVTNDGNPTISNFAGIGGAGASASIGSTGAAASVGLSFIGSGPVTPADFGDITQTAFNFTTGTVNNTGGVITLDGPVSGPGSSASISATGAIASVSLSHIINTGGEGSFALGAIDQTSANAGVVNNSGAIVVTTGELAGPGTSAVVSATGAAASVSTSSIAATGLRGTPVIESITQTVSNSANVTNAGTLTLNGGMTGAGAAASVSAVGAGAYASFAALSQTPVGTAAPAGGAGTPVQQTVNNSGHVTGSATDQIVTGVNGGPAEPIAGPGSSVSVASTGAAAAVGITGINADFGAPVLASVTQTSTNSGNVATPASTALTISGGGNNITGRGTSVSVSSTGAFSALSATGIANGVGLAFGDVTVEGDVNQTTTNTGAVTVGRVANNPGNSTPSGEISGYRIRGDGVSLAVTATGAASSVGSTFIGATGGSAAIAESAAIIQSTTGAGTVYNWGEIGSSAFHSGQGSSFSIAATGAISSVAGTAISSSNTSNIFGDVGQTTVATAATFNQGRYNIGTGGHFQGDGMTASISATGATSAVSATSISSTDASIAYGDVNQNTVATGTASVANRSYFSHNNSNLVGHGTTDTSSAIGAISSASGTVIRATNTELTYASLTQSSNNAASVRNDSLSSFGFNGNLQGDGSALAISSSGAASVFGVSVIRSAGLAVEVGDVQSFATNSGSVINNNSSSGFSANPEGNLVNPTLATGTLTANGDATTTALQGAGSSMSVSASGATAAFSVNSIGNTADPITIDVASVTQSATNTATGSVNNYGGTIAVNHVTGGQIAGAGASASISASGAVASFAVSSINDAGTVAPTVGSISQTASNAGAVSNSPGATGNVAINVANGITGAGASASISAVGAGAYTSFSAIKAP